MEEIQIHIQYSRAVQTQYKLFVWTWHTDMKHTDMKHIDMKHTDMKHIDMRSTDWSFTS